jgi:hypothetical protein
MLASQPARNPDARAGGPAPQPCSLHSHRASQRPDPIGELAARLLSPAHPAPIKPDTARNPDGRHGSEPLSPATPLAPSQPSRQPDARAGGQPPSPAHSTPPTHPPSLPASMLASQRARNPEARAGGQPPQPHSLHSTPLPPTQPASQPAGHESRRPSRRPASPALPTPLHSHQANQSASQLAS